MTTIGELDLRQLTDNIWKSLRCEVTPVCWEELSSTRDMMSGLVHLSGAWDGDVVLQCSEPAARAAAGSMLGVTPEDATPEELRDVVCELTNMTGGGVKALLPSPIKLSLPTYVTGIDYGIRMPGRLPVVERAFLCDGNAIVVRILHYDPSYRPRELS